MKKKYTSEDGSVEFFTRNLDFNHIIYVLGDIVGDISFRAEPTISFDESFIFIPETLQKILNLAYKAKEDINVKDRHLQTLKDYQSWRVGDETKQMPASEVLSEAMQWAIEKLENDDI